MIAKESGWRFLGAVTALTLVVAFGTDTGFAQGQTKGRPPAKATAESEQPAPKLELTAIPANPSDPICIVNNQVISREQLAHECIVRKGDEILKTLITRTLIEQALRKAKLEVTAAEIDAEIDNVARRLAGLGREAWLRTLDKERGISPVQYARDIIYPTLALRKLASPRVQVTQTDMTKSFEAQYGDKIRCRLIMVDKPTTAREIWEEIRKNPAGFEKLAMERSMDSGSRSLGGLLGEPICRHAYPETVSDAAFRQLVDGDPNDKDATHKPKDGDFTGPIQVAENTWVILRRESLIQAQAVDPKNPQVKQSVYDMIYEVKLNEAMSAYMEDLLKKAAIDNKLTGHVKLANEDMNMDENVELMGNKPPKSPAANRPPAGAGKSGATSPAPSTSTNKTPPPAALSQDVIQQTEGLTKKPNSPK
jgi:foldase protein PrsA